MVVKARGKQDDVTAGEAHKSDSVAVGRISLTQQDASLRFM